MIRYDFPAHPGKLFVLLGETAKADFTAWFLGIHAPAITAQATVKKYIASTVITDAGEQAKELTGGTGIDPFGIVGVDEIWGASWDEMKSLYADANIIGAYEVTEHVIRELRTDRPLGIKGPELKRIGLLFKPQEKTHDQAMQHWLNVHTLKTIKHISGMASYNQNHVTRTLTEASPNVDGLNCLLFWNEAAIRYGFFSRPDSYEDLQTDCDNFRSTTYTLLAQEYVMKNS